MSAARPAHVPMAQFPVVGDCLLYTLEKGLGPAWTPDVKTAWTAAYTTLANFMIGEAYGEKVA